MFVGNEGSKPMGPVGFFDCFDAKNVPNDGGPYYASHPQKKYVKLTQTNKICESKKVIKKSAFYIYSSRKESPMKLLFVLLICLALFGPVVIYCMAAPYSPSYFSVKAPPDMSTPIDLQ